MIKSYKPSILIVLFSVLSAFRLVASPQMSDYIIFKGDTISIYNLILEQYLKRQDTATIEKLFDLSFRNGASLNCWRGYQAIYKLDNDSLFLVDIINCGERRSGNIDKNASAGKIKAIFRDNVANSRVYIDWFTGDINFPLNNKVLRWDGVFYTIFEKETVVSVVNGKVLKVEEVENYEDAPERLQRKDKSKIADILFRKLKKVKWKSTDDCDCSDKYFITIDETGNVSNVRMLYTPEEIEKYYDKEEYDYCVITILNAVGKLHFDVVKDKGKPIAEDIYIEIFFTDKGKIENWTH